MSKKKCPRCGKVFDDKEKLFFHLETKHSKDIINNWTGAKYYYYLTHGTTEGKCYICKGKTEFNDKSGKPEFFCKNPKCRETYRKNFENNMKRKYGKTCLLDDPEYQEKKMLANRSITKQYKWSDGSYKTCVGSYEYDFAQFMDVFMDFPSNDVIMPAPMIIDYEYEGVKRFYIPDAYIGSLNLIIEIKDGGNNPNMHHKIQAVDKVKEKLKEEAIRKQGKYNYVKIENKQYGILIETLKMLKNKELVGNENERYIPVFITEENRSLLESAIIENSTPSHFNKDIYLVSFNFKNDPIILYGLKIENEIYYFMNRIMQVCTLENVEINDMYTYSTSYVAKDFLDRIRENLDKTLPEDVNAFNFPLWLIDKYANTRNLGDLLETFDGDMSKLRYAPFYQYHTFAEGKDDIDLNESSNIDIEAVPIEEEELKEIFNEDVNELNKMNLTMNEKSILRMIQESSNKDELLLTEAFMYKIYDDDKKELFNELLTAKKVQLKV